MSCIAYQGLGVRGSGLCLGALQSVSVSCITYWQLSDDIVSQQLVQSPQTCSDTVSNL